MKTITIEIDTAGNIKREGFGFKGKECDEKMKAFDELGKVTEKKLKPEYHQTVTTQQKVGG